MMVKDSARLYSIVAEKYLSDPELSEKLARIAKSVARMEETLDDIWNDAVDEAMSMRPIREIVEPIRRHVEAVVVAFPAREAGK